MSEPTSMGPSLDAWRMTRWPKSIWRVGARKVIQDVVEAIALMEPAMLSDKAAVLERVDAAYPFGTREMLPYKMWLLERKLFRAALDGPAVAPSADEAGACEVAGDLVELGRIDEARSLLEERAPNRLALACPVCGAGPTRPCILLASDARFIALDYPTTQVRSVTPLLVPHLSRLGLHGRDVSPGPLFEGASK